MDLESLNFNAAHRQCDTGSYEEITDAEVQTSTEDYVINDTSVIDIGSDETTDSDTCMNPIEKRHHEIQPIKVTSANTGTLSPLSNNDANGTNHNNVYETFGNIQQTPFLDKVTVINNNVYSSEMTVREKIMWLEKRVHELKNMVDGDELWMVSKEGHAMKVKCILSTSELPQCKGIGRTSTTKFLRRMREALVSGGVSESDWVTLASSRLKGDLKSAWEIEYKHSPNMNWTEFSNFMLCYPYKKRKITNDENHNLKKRNVSMEDIIIKKNTVI